MGQSVLRTKYFGDLPVEDDARIEFPWGVPGFERQRWFVAIREPRTEPLIFLQSLEDTELCFVTLPPQSVDAVYRLRLADDDLRRLELPMTRQPRIGRDVQCLAVLALRESGTTVNLLAPIVINPRTMRAVQAVNENSGYSHQAQIGNGAPSC